MKRDGKNVINNKNWSVHTLGICRGVATFHRMSFRIFVVLLRCTEQHIWHILLIACLFTSRGKRLKAFIADVASEYFPALQCIWRWRYLLYLVKYKIAFKIYVQTFRSCSSMSHRIMDQLVKKRIIIVSSSMSPELLKKNSFKRKKSSSKVRESFSKLKESSYVKMIQDVGHSHTVRK